MYYGIEDLPKTLVVKKSKQNLELLSQYYECIMVDVGNKTTSIPIAALLSDVPKSSGTLVLGTAQTPYKIVNHAKLKEIIIRKQIHPLLAIEYIKEILK